VIAGKAGFFDVDDRLQAPTGDPLELLAAVVNFEPFRPDLDIEPSRSDFGARVAEHEDHSGCFASSECADAFDRLFQQYDAALR